MAINFAEVFLRESGAAQDRASNMVQLQLQANKFASDQAIAQANALANKANAASLTALRNFQIEVGREQQDQRKKLYDNEITLSDLNVDIAEAKRDEVELNLQTAQETRDYLSSTISEEKANKYNLPLTTTNQEYNIFLEERQKSLTTDAAALQLQATQEAMDQQAEQTELFQDFTRMFLDMNDQPISLEEAPGYVDPDDRISFLGRVGRGIAGGLLGASLLLGRNDSNIDPSLFELNPDYYNPTQAIRDTRDRLRFERQTGITQEAAEEVVGRRPSELSGLDPKLLQVLSQIQILGSQAPESIAASGLLLGGAGINTPRQFVQQYIQQQQARAQNPPPVEE